MSTTITTYNQIIEDYINWFQKKTPTLFEPEISLSALDIYLMRQITDFMPSPPQVVDIGTEQSFGISQLMWLHQFNIRQLITVRPPIPLTSAPWYVLLKQYIENKSQTETFLINEIDVVANLPGEYSVDDVICLIVGDIDTQIASIRKCYEIYPNAICFLLPLPRLNQHKTLDLMKTLDNLHTKCCLTGLREWSPFFSESELGIIYPCNRQDIDRILTRLSQLYKGNHDFLSLLKLQIGSQVETMSQTMIQLNEQLQYEKEEQIIAAQVQPPSPTKKSRFFRRIFRQNISSDNVPTFRTSQNSWLKSSRNMYHQLIPLRLRLQLRNLRLRILGF